MLDIPSLESHSNSVAANRPWSTSASTSTAVLDLEKFHLPSLEAHSSSAATNRPWTYIGAIGPPAEANFEATLPTETLLTSEEAVIAAAAAEAVTLARTAAKVAKDAAMMFSHHNSTKSDIKSTVLPSEADNSLFERPHLAQLRETEQAGIVRELESAESEIESDSEEPTPEELELLQAEASKSIAVRSSRQPERKARRARAAERTSASVVSVKSGSTSKKKTCFFTRYRLLRPIALFERNYQLFQTSHCKRRTGVFRRDTGPIKIRKTLQGAYRTLWW